MENIPNKSMMKNNLGQHGNIDIDAIMKQIRKCSSFGPEIYHKLRAAEIQRRPDYNYMKSVQQEIKPHLRGILVNWLVQLAGEHNLVNDTLYRTIYCIDMYLSRRNIQKRGFQLFTIACMCLASKYEDIYTPSPESFCNYVAHKYTKDESQPLEAEIRKTLEFQLAAPTAYTFLVRFLLLAHASYEGAGGFEGFKLECMAKYLTELSLTHYDSLRFTPSVIAASAIFLARWTLTQSTIPWTAALESYTKYKPSNLKETVVFLQTLQLKKDSCHADAIRAKYNKSIHFEVAEMKSPQLDDRLFLR